jgi:hypothetical protein
MPPSEPATPAPLAPAAPAEEPVAPTAPITDEPPLAALDPLAIPAWEDPDDHRREPVIVPNTDNATEIADAQGASDMAERDNRFDPIDVVIAEPPAPTDLPLIDPPTEDEAQAAELVEPPAEPSHAAQRPLWPFVIAGLLLSLLLMLQLAHRFRTEIGVLLPGARAIYTALGIDVPLPRQSELIGIESSDLQADTSRNLLILNAQLKNRAPYSQSYPALEVTLTDARDAVLLRRVLQPQDYLTPDSPPLFAPNAELPLKLWLDPGNTGATGYRLYVFYP